jgi:hypothetical protein
MRGQVEDAGQRMSVHASGMERKYSVTSRGEDAVVGVNGSWRVRDHRCSFSPMLMTVYFVSVAGIDDRDDLAHLGACGPTVRAPRDAQWSGSPFRTMPLRRALQLARPDLVRALLRRVRGHMVHATDQRHRRCEAAPYEDERARRQAHALGTSSLYVPAICSLSQLRRGCTSKD